MAGFEGAVDRLFVLRFLGADDADRLVAQPGGLVEESGPRAVLPGAVHREVRSDREQPSVGLLEVRRRVAVHGDGQHVVLRRHALDDLGCDRRGDDDGEGLVVLGGGEARGSAGLGGEDRLGPLDHMGDELDLPPGHATVLVDLGDDRFGLVLGDADLGRQVLLGQRRQVRVDHRDLDRVGGDADRIGLGLGPRVGAAGRVGRPLVGGLARAGRGERDDSQRAQPTERGPSRHGYP